MHALTYTATCVGGVKVEALGAGTLVAPLIVVTPKLTLVQDVVATLIHICDNVK